jgi:Tfp pilus assembly protein PilW
MTLIGIRRRLTPPARREEGFTLVELIIYAMLMTVVVALAGAIFLSALTGQRDVAATANGDNTGQLVSQSISNGIRSATYIRVTTISSTTQMLVVATPGRTVGSPVTKCQAWYFTADNGGAVYTLTSGSTILVPTLTALTSTWSLLATGVGLSTRVGAPAAMLTPNSLLGTTSVSYEFTMSNGTGRPILISSSATSRQNIALIGSTLCI